jgi:DNA mismatch endonuclease, patch repair protein
MDNLTPVERSRLMGKIHGKDSKPEKTVRSILHGLGFRFRLHRSDLPGTPDIVLPKYRTVVFVHGCFWHRHEGCRRTTTPKTRQQFWVTKFMTNVERDKRVKQALTAMGWRVITLWECETVGVAAQNALVLRLTKDITQPLEATS